MPMLDIGNLHNIAENYRAQVAVQTVIAWPKDKDARCRYIATVMAENLGRLEAEWRNLPDPAAAGDWFDTINAVRNFEDLRSTISVMETWFQIVGGFGAVAQASSLAHYEKEVKGEIGRQFGAGLILALIRRMAEHHADLPGGASVNKAIFVCERVKAPLVPRNQRDLRKAWTDYKPSSHLCAALFDVFISAISENDDAEMSGNAIRDYLTEQFPCFLSMAFQYQSFGTTYIPPRAKKPLLDPSETWMIPDNQTIPRLNIRPVPLGERMLAAAKCYKAPIPGA
jgi:hypothetical protein